MFITRSTIFVPITTGLTLSLTLEYPRLTAGTEVPLGCIGALPLEGEQDCRLGLPVGPGSTEAERGFGAPGLPLVAESGLSGNVVLKFGGVSNEKPGMSDGFHGLDLAVGDVPRDEGGFLDGVGIALATGEEGLTWEIVGFVDGALAEVIGRRVGVADLDIVLGGGTVGLEVGVEDLAVDLDRGVVDLDGPAGFVELIVDLIAGPVGLVAEAVGLAAVGVSLAAETDALLVDVVLVTDTVDLELFMEGLVVDGNVAREVGVEGLEDLEFVVNMGLPVGVAGLDPGPPDDEGLRLAPLEELSPGEEVGCLEAKLFLAAGSVEEFANLEFNAFGRAFESPV